MFLTIEKCFLMDKISQVLTLTTYISMGQFIKMTIFVFVCLKYFFLVKYNLERHLKRKKKCTPRCTDGKIICKECNEEITKSNISRHMLRKHMRFHKYFNLLISFHISQTHWKFFSTLFRVHIFFRINLFSLRVY